MGRLARSDFDDHRRSAGLWIEQTQGPNSGLKHVMHASPLPVSGERNGTGASQADSLQLPKMEDHQEVHRQTGGSEMKLTPVGMEIAKPVFQVHTVDAVTGEIVNKRLKGAKLLEYFAHRGPGLAVQKPGQGVAVQTEGQQAVFALHRMCPQLVKFRTRQIHSLRGWLTEKAGQRWTKRCLLCWRGSRIVSPAGGWTCYKHSGMG